MSVEVFKAACRFRKNGELVPFDELVNSPSLLIEV
jgi:aryl carrier-like protein